MKNHEKKKVETLVCFHAKSSDCIRSIIFLKKRSFENVLNIMKK